MTSKEQHMKSRTFIASLVLALLASTSSMAADKIKVVSSFRGFWDTTLVEFGKEKGIFAAEGLDVDLVFAQGGGIDVLQTVIAGGADLGIGTGVSGALAAVAKGAPVVIVASEFVGSSDVYFYAKSTSPIQSFKEMNGKKLGAGSRGSTVETVASLLASSLNVKMEMVASGGPPATMSQVMTGQVDAGWSVYPIGMDKVNSGEVRIIGSGNDAPGVAGENTRVSVANKAFAQKNEALLQRFFKAYTKVVDWAYSGDEALAKYAALNKISLDSAREVVKKGYPKEALATQRIGPLDRTVAEAVRNKVLDKPLSAQEVSEMLKLVSVVHK